MKGGAKDPRSCKKLLEHIASVLERKITRTATFSHGKTLIALVVLEDFEDGASPRLSGGGRGPPARVTGDTNVEVSKNLPLHQEDSVKMYNVRSCLMKHVTRMSAADGTSKSRPFRSVHRLCTLTPSSF
jgi:hypothetical protein